MLDDHRPFPSLQRACVSCYVDHFGVLSVDPAKVRESVRKVRAICDQRGLEYHELVEAQEGFDHLGMEGTPQGVIAINGK